MRLGSAASTQTSNWRHCGSWRRLSPAWRTDALEERPFRPGFDHEPNHDCQRRRCQHGNTLRSSATSSASRRRCGCRSRTKKSLAVSSSSSAAAQAESRSGAATMGPWLASKSARCRTARASIVGARVASPGRPYGRANDGTDPHDDVGRERRQHVVVRDVGPARQGYRVGGMEVDDRAIRRPGSVHGQVEPRLLRGRRASHRRAGGVHQAQLLWRETAQRDVRWRHQIPTVIEPRAQIAGRTAPITSGKQGTAIRGHRLSTPLLRHATSPNALTKRSGLPKLPDFIAMRETFGIKAVGPGHARIDFFAEGEDAECRAPARPRPRSLHPRRQTSAHAEAASAAGCGERVFDQTSGLGPPEPRMSRPHRRGIGRGVNQQALCSKVLARPIDRPRNCPLVLARAIGIDGQARHQRRGAFDLGPRGCRATSAQAPRPGATAMAPVSRARPTAAMGPAASQRAAQRRSARDQRQRQARLCHGSTWRSWMLSTIAAACPSARKPCQAQTGDRRAVIDVRKRNQPDGAPALPAEDANQVGVCHRRQRMMPHRRLGEQFMPHEEVSLVDRALQGRIRRTGDGEIAGTSASSASRTGPMLPSSVESKVEQYLK